MAKRNRNSNRNSNRKPATPKVVVHNLCAADLLKSDHPLRPAFLAWVENKGAVESKRQASRFLLANPSMRDGRFDVVTKAA